LRDYSPNKNSLSHAKERAAAVRVQTPAAAAICLVLVVYDIESMGPCLLYLLLRWQEEVGTLHLCSALLKGP
jgi:hypothetical protein